DAALINLLQDIQGASLENAAAYALLVHSAVVLPIVLLGLAFVWRANLSVRHLFSASGPAITQGEPDHLASFAIARASTGNSVGHGTQIRISDRQSRSTATQP